MSSEQPLSEVSTDRYENSRWIMASYGSREMFSQWITSAFGLYTLVFYETVVGLQHGWALVGFLIYSVWNAINDPILGYLFEKYPTRWQKKKGYKRFPWIVIMAGPWLLAYFSIFMVPYSWTPATSQLKIFLWYVFSLILFDGTFSMMEINSTSLFPEKFRNANERRTAQGYGTILGIIGLVLAFLLTGLVIPADLTPYSRTDAMTFYRYSATISVVGGIFLFLLVIPGIYENAKMRKRNLEYLEQIQDKPRVPFIPMMKQALSNRAFVFKIIFFFGYQASVALVNASASYVTIYLLNNRDLVIFLLGSMLLGALITVPLWVFISNRVNNNKLMSLAGSIIMLISYIPMIFVWNLYYWMISLFIFGIGLSGQWFMDPPTMGDVLDDIEIKTGKREPSIYYGYQTFFIRFGEGFKAATILIAHELLGFIVEKKSLTELMEAIPNAEKLNLALFSIRVHTAIVPAILVLITTILFWKFYPLTPAKVMENKELLKQIRKE